MTSAHTHTHTYIHTYIQHKEIMHKALSDNDKRHREQFPELLQQFLRGVPEDVEISQPVMKKLLEHAKNADIDVLAKKNN